MAGVRLILKFQWKAYWRRFKRAGQLPQFDMLLLLLLGALALHVSPRPFIGVLAAIIFFVTAASLGWSLSHFMGGARLRRSLMIAVAIIIVPLGAVLFAAGKDATRRLKTGKAC